MASRKALQEIPIFPPETEQQTFVFVGEEVTPAACAQNFSARAHAKYISNDESKENITPTELDNINKETYGFDLGKLEDLTKPEDQEGSCGLSIDISSQPKDDKPLEMTTGAKITPRKDAPCSDWRIGESYTPVDFSSATVHDFGISSESFTNSIGKSPKSLHKHRRRSTIGIRGSPEMNFLIRQIALQRSQRSDNPEPPPSNPFISPRNSALKEKMSCFRNVFQAVEENEGKVPFPGFSKEEEQTKSDTLERKDPDMPKEDIAPADISKRGQKRKVMFSDLNSLPESKRINHAYKPECNTSSTPGLKPSLKKTSWRESSSSRDELGGHSVRFLVSESSDNEDITLFRKPVNDSVKKKKRVTFGRELSPELFDKTLPPDTPLRRGSTPYHQQILGTATPTATRSSPCTPLQQPDFSCTDEQDTLQPLALCFESESPEQDSYIPLSSPGNEQVCQIKELEDVIWEDNQAAEEATIHVCNDVLEQDSTDASAVTTDENELFIDSVPGPSKRRVTRISNKSKSKTKAEKGSNDLNMACRSEHSPADDSSQKDYTSKPQIASTNRSIKRSRKPVGVMKRSQVKAPRGKGKKPRGRPKKSVQKPLYAERETVSKKPLLSPIAELPECYPTPPSHTNLALGGALNKGLIKRIPKRRGIQKGVGKLQNINSELVDLSSVKTENVTEDAEQKDFEVNHSESLTDGPRDEGPADLDIQVDTSGTSAECPLSSAEEEQTQDECIVEPSESVAAPEEGSVEVVTAPKPQHKPKRRSTSQRRVSQTARQSAHIPSTDPPTDIFENVIIADCNSMEVSAEDQEPEKDVMDNKAHSPKLPITCMASGNKGRRSRSYRISDIFCPSTEPNPPPGPSTQSLHPEEESSAPPNEPLLSIDEILQSNGGEKRVRRSMRLRRDSGVSGLFWVQENTSRGGTSRRKSLSSAVQPPCNSNTILESVINSPNEEQLGVQTGAKRRSLNSKWNGLQSSELTWESDQKVPSAARKTRRRTLCTSSLQQTTSLSDTKSRKSNVSYQDSYVVGSQTCHMTLDS